MVKLYGIKACDTVKKTRTWLDGRGIVYEFHDYKISGIDPERLRHWAARVGWEVLLNRAGTTFRKLPEEARADIDERSAIALMTTQPSMIKRPVLEAGETLLVGFKPEAYFRALEHVR